MPYTSPSPCQSSSSARPLHRRTRSCSATFSDEKGPGAFSSLGSLPKRKPLAKKAVFHLQGDHSEDENSKQATSPALFISLPQAFPGGGSVPFPSSALLSPLSPSTNRAPSSGTKSPLPRTTSSPIILSNGKPLKPSLKSASSSPVTHISHLRAQSAPASPSIKNVHFAESDKDLESVRVFNRTGKPASIGKGGEDTETETEADNASYFPFSPPMPPAPARLPVIDPAVTSPIPNFSSGAYSNIYIETISFPKSRPAALYGSILVRNVTFEKQVALRFTLDGWQTTSEVLCKHVVSLPSLPPPFPRTRTVGDAVGMLSNGVDHEQSWDRFSFSIQLEYYEQKLPEQTILFVGRFTCPLGEWWDNNDGNNYRLGFKRLTISPTNSSCDLATFSQQKSFTAPTTMKTTPVTATTELAGMLPFPSLSPRTSPVSAQPPAVPATATPTLAAEVSPLPLSQATSIMNPTSPASSGPSALAERRGVGKINLTNYAAPATQPTTQTPTPPRSRSGSFETPSSKTLAAPTSKVLRNGPPSFTSPRSSPPRIASPRAPSPPSSGLSITPRNTQAPLSGTSSPTASSVHTPPGFSPSPLSPVMKGGDLPSAELRAALVKQWCFAQSTPPTPGVVDTPSLLKLDVTPVVEEVGVGVISLDSERDLAAEVMSPKTENPYSWWIGAGIDENNRPGNGGGWFNWSADHLARIPRAATIGV